MKKIVLIEDDADLYSLVQYNLEKEGFQVVGSQTGKGALELCRRERPDLVILDIMLPGMDGLEVCRRLRSNGTRIPILLLTARVNVDDRITGLDSGADDYLTKPFDLAILIARIRGLLRRREWLNASRAPETPTPPDVFTFAGKSVDFNRLELKVKDEVVPLTLMEANVLRYLIQHEGQPVPRKKLLEDVWGLHEDTDTRAIDNFMVRLRRYVEDEPSRPRHMLTVRGVGYRFVAEPK